MNTQDVLNRTHAESMKLLAELTVSLERFEHHLLATKEGVQAHIKEEVTHYAGEKIETRAKWLTTDLKRVDDLINQLKQNDRVLHVLCDVSG